MLELTSDDQPVRLSPGTSVQLELNSPLFDEDTIKGSFSYSFSVPAGPNGPLYGYPERPDRAGEPGALLPAALADDGLPLLVGTQRVKSATPAKYSVTVQAGLSGANLSGRQLSSFAYGGLRSVPRWVAGPLDGGGNAIQVPGLVGHANDVVARPAAFDYVFAPLRNEYLTAERQALLKASAAVIDPLAYPDLTVNAWQVYPVQVFGMPPAGSFTYHINFQVPGGVQLQAFQLLPPYCPFPKLRYVLQAICEESGLAVDLPNLLPGELGDLVIAGNAQLVDRGDAASLRFSLADVLPALTVAELLAALRQDLGLVVYVDPLTQRVRSAYLYEQVAPGAAYTDLSPCLAGAPEVSIEDVAGLTLTYHVDSDDALTKDALSKQPEPSLVLAPVATVAQLPTSAVIRTEAPASGQVRLVQETTTYYVCTLGLSVDGISVPLTWSLLVVALAPVPVLGGGDEQAQATCYTTELPTQLLLDATNPLRVLLPAISQAPYRADQKVVARSTALRLLFYNGLRTASDGVTRYPQLSHQSLSGRYSVRLGGGAGTYAQLLQAWLPVKLRGTSYKQPLLLSSLDLARLDLARPLWLAGVPYLVRKLSATVPLRKAATVELVRL